MTEKVRPIRLADLVLDGLTRPEQDRISRGPFLSSTFLPHDDPFPGLADLRARHVRLRDELSDVLAELKQLDADHKAIDERYREALLAAVMTGDRQPKDDRPSQAVRDSARRATEERALAIERALVRLQVELVEHFRAHETEWLDTLKQQLGPINAKRAEAERLLAEAAAEEWRLHALGRWVQRTADDGAIGVETAPLPDDPPGVLGFNGLERPRHEAERRPWLGGEDDQALVQRLAAEYAATVELSGDAA